MAQASPMNNGDGAYSYAQNSHFQRNGLNAAMGVMNKVLVENLDVKSLLSGSSTFRIADLGCSVGPNTFFGMEMVVKAVKNQCESQGLEPSKLQFQVFFNDIPTNDFNMLFTSLPSDRKYYAAGVPGSFYDRLFPSSSIHFVHNAFSLHWLSKLPMELQINGSPAWNAGKIHYTGASDAVVQAYMNQFEEDMGTFLRIRAQEIVPGGLVVILMPGVHDGVLPHAAGIAFTFFGAILMDMVKEGILNQDQVDSFNIPHFYPSAKQMTNIVEKNACFSIAKMEVRNAGHTLNNEAAIMHFRALSEGTFFNHFGRHEIGDEVFKRAIQQKDEYANMFYLSGVENNVHLFAVLKRN